MANELDLHLKSLTDFHKIPVRHFFFNSFLITNRKPGGIPGAPQLFFPDYSHNPVIEPQEYWKGDEEFVVALTNQMAERWLFSFCNFFVFTEFETNWT